MTGTRCAGICPDGIKRAETMTNEGCPVCKNPLRHDKVCPYSPRDAADRCDPDHFMTRVSVKGAVA